MGSGTKNWIGYLGLVVWIALAVQCTSSYDDEVYFEDGIGWIELSHSIVDTTIFYVSPSGDDAASGMSEYAAFKTIMKALQVIQPGGTIRIMPGEYLEAIGVEGGGNTSAVITIEGYGSESVLNGGNTLAIGLFFEGSTNFVIRELTFQSYSDIGIGLSFCSNFVIKDLVIKENGHDVQLEDWELEGYGIHVEHSEYVEIAHNEVFRNGPKPQIIPHFLMGTGINTYNNRNLIIRDNISFDNIGGGILVEDSYDITVENNEVYGNDLDATVDGWWDGGLWLDGGARVMVRGNYFHDNNGPGIEISDEDHQDPSGYSLVDNVSSDNYYGILIWNFGTSDWPDASVISLSGNDFSGNNTQDIVINKWYCPPEDQNCD